MRRSARKSDESSRQVSDQHLIRIEIVVESSRLVSDQHLIRTEIVVPGQVMAATITCDHNLTWRVRELSAHALHSVTCDWRLSS